jgi:hypothetical protein
MIAPRVYIIILNYNGWKDTVECLETVFRSDYPDYKVVVADNNSTDDSILRLKKWAEGDCSVESTQQQLSHLFVPPLRKPIPFLFFEAKSEANLPKMDKSRMVVLQTGKNLGYAAGNNEAIKYALSQGDCDYIWILNNDVVVETDALAKVVEHAETTRKRGFKIGLTGSKILYYKHPSILQAAGGGPCDEWTGRSWQKGDGEKDIGQYDNDSAQLDYILGAAVLVPTAFLRDVGLMCEDYFLFAEERDWAIRGRRKDWLLNYAYLSRIYHKDAGSMNRENGGDRGLLDFYMMRSRVIFAKKFFPRRLWFVRACILISFLKRICRGEFSTLPFVARAMLFKVNNSLD